MKNAWLIMYSLLLLLSMTTNVWAERPVARVDVIQGRAAYERDGQQFPLVVDQTLFSGDYITTSSDGRLLIRFMDNTTARVGSGARVKMARLQPNENRDGSLSASFEVVKGMFRYSSGAGAIGRHEIDIKVGNSITAGIRGTDVFVKSGAEEDWVCLIEGKVQVHSGDVGALLDERREFFVVKHGQAPEPIDFLDEKTFRKWLRGTEVLQNPDALRQGHPEVTVGQVDFF